MKCVPYKKTLMQFNSNFHLCLFKKIQLILIFNLKKMLKYNQQHERLNNQLLFPLFIRDTSIYREKSEIYIVQLIRQWDSTFSYNENYDILKQFIQSLSMDNLTIYLNKYHIFMRVINSLETIEFNDEIIDNLTVEISNNCIFIIFY